MFAELTKGLYLITGEQGGRFPFANGLLVDSRRKVLVDTGFGPSRRAAIQESFKIDVIVNTHYHLDHAYGNKYFPSAQVWAHVLDAPAIRSPEVFYSLTGLNEEVGVPDPEFFPDGPGSRQVARELKDKELLDFGGVQLQVLHTPGHTPGHIALYEPTAGILFSADIDLSPFGPWYGNLASDIDEFAGSIRRLADLQPRLLVTSHSSPITEDIPARFAEYAAKFAQREAAILHHLTTAKSVAELVEAKIIFPRHPEPQRVYRYFERIMLEKHIIHLLRQGKVTLRADQKFKACI